MNNLENLDLVKLKKDELKDVEGGWSVYGVSPISLPLVELSLAMNDFIKDFADGFVDSARECRC